MCSYGEAYCEIPGYQVHVGTLYVFFFFFLCIYRSLFVERGEKNNL